MAGWTHGLDVRVVLDKAAGAFERKDSVMVDTKVKDALDYVRAGAQELHGAISDAAAKRGGAAKVDLEAISQKAKAITESMSSVGAKNEATKKHLTEAATHLGAVQNHAAEAMKSTGKEFQTSVRKALADARASVQEISEAVAATRSTKPSTSRK
jgi:hypothetical protein